MTVLASLVLFAVLNITFPAPYVGPDCVGLPAKCATGDGGQGGAASGGMGDGNGK